MPSTSASHPYALNPFRIPALSQKTSLCTPLCAKTARFGSLCTFWPLKHVTLYGYWCTTPARATPARTTPARTTPAQARPPRTVPAQAHPARVLSASSARPQRTLRAPSLILHTPALLSPRLFAKAPSERKKRDPLAQVPSIRVISRARFRWSRGNPDPRQPWRTP